MPRLLPKPCWMLCSLLLLVPGAVFAQESGPLRRPEPPRSVHLLDAPLEAGPGPADGRTERLQGRHASLSGVLLGASIGALVGGLLAAPDGSGLLAAITVPLGALVGALIGAEGPDDEAHLARRSNKRARFQPVLAVSGERATLGLDGRF